MPAKKTVDNSVENTEVQAEQKVEHIPAQPNLDIMVPCFLPADEDKPESERYEIVCVNGKNYQIACGVYVNVPYKVFEALYNSGRFKRL